MITPISAEDEVTRRELGYPGPQNFVVPTDRLRLGERAWARLRRKPLMFFNHAPAAFVRRYVEPLVWSGYFKFCFERNPYDKAISNLYWNTHGHKKRPPIADYLEREREDQLSNWSIYTLDNRIAVDFVGRYEHIEEDLREALRRVAVTEQIVLPRAKAQYRVDRRHYSEVLDVRARARMDRVCAREMAAFGYRWEDRATG